MNHKDYELINWYDKDKKKNIEILESIAKNPIKINTELYSYPYLARIVKWIELVNEYGKNLNIEWKFIGLDDILGRTYGEKDFIADSKEFTQEMRNASFGTEYKEWKITPGLLHDYGETWSYEQLVLTSNTGIIWWYCKKLFKNNYEKICDDINIQLLGAFFHRTKIILENVNKLLDFLFNNKKFENLTLDQVIKINSSPYLEKKNSTIFLLTNQILQTANSKDIFFDNYLNIEKVIDLSQLNIFLIVKNF